jgi:hypothetical protein
MSALSGQEGEGFAEEIFGAKVARLERNVHPA